MTEINHRNINPHMQRPLEKHEKVHIRMGKTGPDDIVRFLENAMKASKEQSAQLDTALTKLVMLNPRLHPKINPGAITVKSYRGTGHHEIHFKDARGRGYLICTIELEQVLGTAVTSWWGNWEELVENAYAEPVEPAAKPEQPKTIGDTGIPLVAPKDVVAGNRICKFLFKDGELANYRTGRMTERDVELYMMGEIKLPEDSCIVPEDFYKVVSAVKTILKYNEGRPRHQVISILNGTSRMYGPGLNGQGGLQKGTEPFDATKLAVAMAKSIHNV